MKKELLQMGQWDYIVKRFIILLCLFIAFKGFYGSVNTQWSGVEGGGDYRSNSRRFGNMGFGILPYTIDKITN